MDKEIAETRALEVLTWVLSEDDLIQVLWVRLVHLRMICVQIL